MKIEIPLSTLLKSVDENYEIIGKTDLIIHGFSGLSAAQKGELSFIQGKKFLSEAQHTRASVLIIPEGLNVDAPEVESTIVVSNPSRFVAKMCGQVESKLFPTSSGIVHAMTSIADTAVIADSVSLGAFTSVGGSSKIGTNTVVGNQVTIGEHCQIGSNTLIDNGVVVESHTVIGDHCRISSGAVIGASGFGYEFSKTTGTHERVPQVGRVVLGDWVDVGANSAIDRARMGDTTVGNGTKIDNLVQVGHNVTIGQHCILCGQVAIAGSAKIGDFVVFGGQAGTNGHIEIASGTQIGGQAGVASSVEKPGSKLWGTPAIDYGLGIKVAMLNKRLPELFRRFKELEKQIAELV